MDRLAPIHSLITIRFLVDVYRLHFQSKANMKETVLVYCFITVLYLMPAQFNG